MEENRTETNTEEKTTVIKETGTRNCDCNEFAIWKPIVCGLLIFLGAFCAFYTVADWHFKRMMPMSIMPPSSGIVDKMIQKDMQKMDKMLKHNEDMYFPRNSKANIVHLEQNEDNYKVIIDLRAFDNNDKNVQVKTNGNILTISARTIKKSKNNEQVSEFQQNYMFGDNVQLANLKKEIEGHYYVIEIPISENDK